MKIRYPEIGLARICGLFGISRQAIYQQKWFQMDRNIEQEIVLQLVREIRKNHPRMGGRKLYTLLAPQLIECQVKMGRDALFDLLAAHGLLVKRRKRRVYTTDSRHWLRKYPNLVDHWVLDRPNKVWVSDITYLRTAQGLLYLSLITDVYSKKILGFKLAETLEAKHTLEALQMAVATLNGPSEHLIHHSDRGVQYCCGEYIKLLQNYQIQISMGEKGDPLENPVAERANGIVKQEYLDQLKELSVPERVEKTEQIIRLYNHERPHMSCEMLTPVEAHGRSGVLKREWKNYYKKPKTDVSNN